MSYEKFRLTDDAISTNGVEAAPDKLAGTPQENKKVFDRLIRAVVKDIINGLAEQIGTDVARFDSGEGKISAETAAALELNEGATLNDALVRLKNMAASGGIPTAEFVAVSKATAEAYGLEGDVTVDMVLQVIVDAITEAAAKSYTKEETLSSSTKGILGLAEDAVPDDAFMALKRWVPLAEYNVAGAYTFTVPEDVDELGVLVLGGGGSGGVAFLKGTSTNGNTYYGAATGGCSGAIVQKVLSKAKGEFSSGAELAVVVGAGGVGVTKTTGVNGGSGVSAGNAGGSSSFAGITAIGGGGGKGFINSNPTGAGGNTNTTEVGGQISDMVHGNVAKAIAMLRNREAPYGLSDYLHGHSSDMNIWEPCGSGERAVNEFDIFDLHIYCGAGAGAYFAAGIDGTTQIMAERAKGRAGKSIISTYDGAVIAETATAPGDGGGAAVKANDSNTYPATSGAGADGLVLVYGRRISK